MIQAIDMTAATAPRQAANHCTIGNVEAKKETPLDVSDTAAP
jgi:hypothetical protein